MKCRNVILKILKFYSVIQAICAREYLMQSMHQMHQKINELYIRVKKFLETRYSTINK